MNIRKDYDVRRLLLIALSSIVTSCGYVAISTKDFHYSSLGVGASRGQLTSGAATDLPLCSPKFLVEKWGEPDERSSLNDSTTVWTYLNGLKWVGASPMVLIPLPLFAPVGREKIHFGVQGDSIVSILHETTQRDVVMVPLFSVHNIPGSVYQTFSHIGCKFFNSPLQH